MVKVRNTTHCIHSGSKITIALSLATCLPKGKRDRKLRIYGRTERWSSREFHHLLCPAESSSGSSISWISFLLNLLFIWTCYTGIKEGRKNPIRTRNERLLGLHVVTGIIIASALHFLCQSDCWIAQLQVFPPYVCIPILMVNKMLLRVTKVDL